MKRGNVQIYVAYFFQFSLLAMFVASILQEEYYPAISSLVGFVLVNVPNLLKRNQIMAVPWELSMWIFLALFLHNFGIYARLYDDIWWWDKLTHFFSTSLIAGLGFISIVIIDKYLDSIHLPPKFLPFFILVFIAATGVFWEIIEFSFDELLGTKMQYSLDDTVGDLVFDLFGGIAVAAAGPFYLKYRSVDSLVKELHAESMFERIVGWWVKE